MIRNINISNFRCFKDVDIQGFERINLFGGKNNSGKTALLEALFLGSTPISETIMILRQIRGESGEFLKAFPEKAWDNLFFDKKETEKKSVIIVEYDDKAKQIKLECGHSDRKFSEIFGDDSGTFFEDLRTRWTESGFKRSALNIHCYEKDEKTVSGSMTATSKGIISNINFTDSGSDEAVFIPAFLRMSNSALAQEFDKSDLEGHSDKVLKAIQAIDESIIQIRTLNIGSPTVYLKRKTQEDLPITLFGEAINRVAHFIVKMVNSRNGILLIDEIENGIHYTNHGELWKMLFKLSKEFNIQIFATTHSYEMIKSFSEVASEMAHESKEEIGAYFEIARNVRTGRIVGIKREIEILKYELARGMELRGE
ncbi:MAG: AAA family ATPase [Desulfobacterales bacterium]